jgi:hypothetical protein
MADGSLMIRLSSAPSGKASARGQLQPVGTSRSPSAAGRATSASGGLKPGTLALPGVNPADTSSMPLTAKSRAMAEAKQAELIKQGKTGADMGGALNAPAVDDPNVDRAPPPDIRQRQLIFDSFQKIQTATPLPMDKAFRSTPPLNARQQLSSLFGPHPFWLCCVCVEQR